jgi:hypothetical protein
MKKIAMLSMIALCSFFGGFAAQQVGHVFADDEPRIIRADEVHASKIIVRDRDNQGSILMQAGKDSVGLWLQGKNRRCISIYDTGEQAAVCLFSDTSKPGGNVAIGADKDGGSLQMIDPKTGDVKIYGFNDFKNFAVNKPSP